VIFDTGSANFWLPVGSNTTSAVRHFFDVDGSSSYEATDKPFRIVYGSGEVSGRFCRDHVALGELTLPNFTFAEVDDYEGLRHYSTWPFDGVMGLGFGSISVGQAPTVMGTLIQSGQLAEPVFGFHLGDGEPGELVLGGVDPRHYVGSFHFVSLAEESYWVVPLDAVSLLDEQGKIMTLNASRNAIVDSGSSLLAGPDKEVRALAAMLGAIEQQGLYLVECHLELPSLAFELGGRSFVLRAEDLIVQREGPFCALGLQGLAGDMNLWILGDVFMRRFYVQFDWGRKRLGFALAADSVTRADNFV
jgi:hypothetical protein